jgi:hypothetical protein
LKPLSLADNSYKDVLNHEKFMAMVDQEMKVQFDAKGMSKPQDYQNNVPA